ncbi:MAG: error-prone DNA polymerase [Phycisphaeraceae bacterium]|nr:error-prone DNA polymerase [Phycisphaeraceae bacterium]
MPHPQEPASHPHPLRRTGAADVHHVAGAPGSRAAVRDAAATTGRPRPPRWVDLQVTTNFSFLRGASHPDELVETAAALGHDAVAVTDHGSLAGVVRAHVAARQAGIPLLVGAQITLAPGSLAEGPSRPSTVENGAVCRDPIRVVVHASDLPSYGRLCRMLSIGRQRAAKGTYRLAVDDLAAHREGLLITLLPDDAPGAGLADAVERLRGGGAALSIGSSPRFDGRDDGRWQRHVAFACSVGVPPAALGDVRYHHPARRRMLDVLTCIRRGCTLDEAGFRLSPNAQRFLRDPEDVQRCFGARGAAGRRAIDRTLDLAEMAAGFSLASIRYEYPDEVCPPGVTPDAHLAALTWAGAAGRFPAGIPDRTRTLLAHELTLIGELGYAPYFLTVHDIVRFARSRGILCQGRGAAANSAVCFCLGITAVDPERIDLLFERFVSRERDEPPDIDIDFEHERREEVIQYVYRTYGRDRAALTAEVITWRERSAVREVGRVLGFSRDLVDRIARNLDWWRSREVDPARFRELGLDPEAPACRCFASLVAEIIGFPRHLSQHVGGFVIARRRLDELVPIERAAMADRTVIEWDKDDLEAMGMLKVDLLGLGMLSCIRRSLDTLNAGPPGFRPAADGAPLDMAGVPPEDPLVYDMICAADTVGVFQIESRAQMSMLPRLRPRSFYDLVIEVAIVRPGPIQGDMVHPYLRRRRGEEAVMFPSPEIERVLGRTLGVPLFQEQAMSLAVVGAGFTPGESDALRRAMAAWKRRGNAIERFREKFRQGMIDRGLGAGFAERCFRQIEGFSEYGFPESHAASFALLVYVSAWLKRHHPAVFAAALINSQPMGFYAPAQIIRDAQSHGVSVLPIDVNASAWACEPVHAPPAPTTPRTFDGSATFPALRLGLRLVRGLERAHAERIVDAVRRHGPFTALEPLRHASGVPVGALRRLAAADALRSLGLDRRRALWMVQSWRDEPLPLFAAPESGAGGRSSCAQAGDGAALPRPTAWEEVVHDYDAIALTLRAHPMSFLRPMLERRSTSEAALLRSPERAPTGRLLRVAGMVLVRQRPSTAKGIVFMTLEDETGTANLLIRPAVYRRFRAAARRATVLRAEGHVERDGDVVHLIVRRLEDLGRAWAHVRSRSRDFH